MAREMSIAERRLTSPRVQALFAVVMSLCAAAYVWLLIHEWGDPVARFLNIWCAVSSVIGAMWLAGLARRQRRRSTDTAFGAEVTRPDRTPR